jgi:hypothetical protein
MSVVNMDIIELEVGDLFSVTSYMPPRLLIAIEAAKHKYSGNNNNNNTKGHGTFIRYIGKGSGPKVLGITYRPPPGSVLLFLGRDMAKKGPGAGLLKYLFDEKIIYVDDKNLSTHIRVNKIIVEENS